MKTPKEIFKDIDKLIVDGKELFERYNKAMSNLGITQEDAEKNLEADDFPANSLKETIEWKRNIDESVKAKIKQRSQEIKKQYENKDNSLGAKKR